MCSAQLVNTETGATTSVQPLVAPSCCVKISASDVTVLPNPLPPLPSVSLTDGPPPKCLSLSLWIKGRHRFELCASHISSAKMPPAARVGACLVPKFAAVLKYKPLLTHKVCH